MEKNTENRKGVLDQSGKKRIVEVGMTVLLAGGLVFLSAGRLDWLWGWVLVGVYLLAMVINLFVVMRVNPEVVNERGRTPENQKKWDKTLLAIYAPFPFLIWIVSGLDGGRFGWSQVPLWVQVVGSVCLFVSFLVITWTLASNAFLSTRVAVQEARGHSVVSEGPYCYVRHPMYLGSIGMFLMQPLLLGSWWGLIPGGICTILMVVRTALEDQTLQAELEGYRAYAEQTRYRLLPGIW